MKEKVRSQEEECPPSPLLDTSTRNKILVLEKHRKEFLDKVRFSEISHHLLSSEYFSKEDCYEICVLPLPQQMDKVFRKCVQILESQSPLNQSEPDHEILQTSTVTLLRRISTKPEFWTILLRSLTERHSGLTCKLGTDFHKLSKLEKPRKLQKEDIGLPQNFRHVKHIGQASGFSLPPLRRYFSLRARGKEASSARLETLLEISESDAELVKDFFARAGVTEAHLNRPGSRKLILEFIEKNGGIDAIKREMQEAKDLLLLGK